MDKEPHPLDERYIAACAWQEPAGNGGVTIICPLCLGELVPTHRRRRGFRYYRHKSDAQGAQCPLATQQYQPAGLAVNGPPDAGAAETQRARFLANWKRHYRIARHAAPNLTIERFIGLIEYADVMKLWSYPQLDQRDLPYVLLVMAGFMTVRLEGRDATWVRFWFDARVRDAGDLWRREAKAARAAQGAREVELFVISYRDPVHTPLPTSSDILSWARVPRVERIEEAGVQGIGRADVRLFERLMAYRLAALDDGPGRDMTGAPDFPNSPADDPSPKRSAN